MAIADATLDALEAAGIATVPDAARRAGYASAVWPGRLELLRVRDRDVLLDGAHNPAGAAALAVALDDLRPFLDGGPVTLVTASMADKDVDGVIAALAQSNALDGATVVATSLDVARALPAARARGALADRRGLGRAGLAARPGHRRAGSRRRPRAGPRRARAGRRRRFALSCRGGARRPRRRPGAARSRPARGPHDRQPAREPPDTSRPVAHRPDDVPLGRADVRDGHPQRDARLVLGRRPAGGRRDRG